MESIYCALTYQNTIYSIISIIQISILRIDTYVRPGNGRAILGNDTPGEGSAGRKAPGAE